MGVMFTNWTLTMGHHLVPRSRRKTRDDDLELMKKTTELCSVSSHFSLFIFPQVFLRWRDAQNLPLRQVEWFDRLDSVSQPWILGSHLVANYPRIVSGLVHPSDWHGISTVNPLITGVISHLLSGMSHQAWFNTWFSCHLYLNASRILQWRISFFSRNPQKASKSWAKSLRQAYPDMPQFQCCAQLGICRWDFYGICRQLHCTTLPLYAQ